MAANLLFSCNSNLIRASYSITFVGVRRRILNLDQPTGRTCGSRKFSRTFLVAATEGSANSSKYDETIPSWARPDSDEPPPWAQDDTNGSGNANSANQNVEIPSFVYLLASAITAIAAIGSVFEYVNQRPVFGILNSDSIFYAPLLGFFAFTGIPTSAFLWFKSVQIANKEAEEQDRRDGYL
ncbi:hypothetical protein P3X46_015749 [Hevea brasiliensis]|uniref:Uncharacterized protein n=1 Tax=Hevea brasiliensis TaxID=3981 RepID=A0ABQ9LWX8_HEVBR|nr:uncharacterized protein LOC110654568 isoform X2 [Hevea brasiliensis]KAJ9172519.1 hypothetical protein P3X46_015749 [Hevea brasiliensis]